MWILSAQEMQAADRAVIDGLGVPGVCLMELAGAGAERILREVAAPQPGEAVAVLCGAGNNGGDGYVVARHLANHGARPTVYLLSPRGRISGDALVNLEAAERRGVPIVPTDTPERLPALVEALARARVRVDALLGTGLRSAVRGMAAEAIRVLNATAERRLTLAIDVPSGLSADTGQPLGAAVRADATVTFAALKRGHLLHPGPTFCGDLHLVDIGIPPGVLARLQPQLRKVPASQALAGLPARPPDCHKGTFGRVLVLAGSAEMAGAGLLAAHGCVRAGAGVVTLCTVEEGCRAARTRYPAILTRARGQAPDPEHAAEEGFTAVVLGPGLGRSPEAAQLVRRWVLGCSLPLVVDADGLNLLSGLGGLEALRDAPAARVLTPHEGEAARLLGVARSAIHVDRLGALQDAVHRSAATVILKGSGTLVGAPHLPAQFVGAGGPALATGGSGDVLAGAVGALLAAGRAAPDAAVSGAYLHGLAGELAALRVGPSGVTPEEIADHLPAAVAELARRAEHNSTPGVPGPTSAPSVGRPTGSPP